jgi:hypothetical protein
MLALTHISFCLLFFKRSDGWDILAVTKISWVSVLHKWNSGPLAKFQHGYDFELTHPPTKPKVQEKICNSWKAVYHYRSCICFKRTFSIKYGALGSHSLLRVKISYRRKSMKFRDDHFSPNLTEKSLLFLVHIINRGGFYCYISDFCNDRK